MYIMHIDAADWSSNRSVRVRNFIASFKTEYLVCFCLLFKNVLMMWSVFFFSSQWNPGRAEGHFSPEVLRIQRLTVWNVISLLAERLQGSRGRLICKRKRGRAELIHILQYFFLLRDCNWDSTSSCCCCSITIIGWSGTDSRGSVSREQKPWWEKKSKTKNARWPFKSPSGDSYSGRKRGTMRGWLDWSVSVWRRPAVKTQAAASLVGMTLTLLSFFPRTASEEKMQIHMCSRHSHRHLTEGKLSSPRSDFSSFFQKWLALNVATFQWAISDSSGLTDLTCVHASSLSVSYLSERWRSPTPRPSSQRRSVIGQLRGRTQVGAELRRNFFLRFKKPMILSLNTTMFRWFFFKWQPKKNISILSNLTTFFMQSTCWDCVF